MGRAGPRMAKASSGAENMHKKTYFVLMQNSNVFSYETVLAENRDHYLPDDVRMRYVYYATVANFLYFLYTNSPFI